MPDQIIECVVEAPAGVTHYASFQFTDYISSDPEPFRPVFNNFFRGIWANISTNTLKHTFVYFKEINYLRCHCMVNVSKEGQAFECEICGNVVEVKVVGGG